MNNTFQAGAAQADITPTVGVSLAGQFNARYTENVDDPLYAKAVVLDDGKIRIAMVVLDLIMILGEDVEEIRAQISERVGIVPENVMIGCTHTHTGPPTRKIPARDEVWMEWIITRVADCVVMATRRLQSARIAHGRGEQHDISFCRRYLMKDGTVHMNPRAGDPNIVRPVSPIDPAVGVLYIEDLNAKPLAVVAQFSLHYVGAGKDNAISADYYGHFAAVMRQHLGEDCIPLLFNGTSAQIISRSALQADRDRGHVKARRVATALAGEVIKMISRESLNDTHELGAVSTKVKLKLQRVKEKDVEIAKQILDDNDPCPGEGPFSFAVGQPIREGLRRAYSSHVLGLAKMPATVNAEVQVLRIGDSAWVALPGEIFSEIGLAIKGQAPAHHTFVIGLANDALGYICTDHAYEKEGGYETWARTGSPVAAGAEGIFVNTAGALLKQLFDGSNIQNDGSQAVK